MARGAQAIEQANQAAAKQKKKTRKKRQAKRAAAIQSAAQQASAGTLAQFLQGLPAILAFANGGKKAPQDEPQVSPNPEPGPTESLPDQQGFQLPGLAQTGDLSRSSLASFLGG